MLTWLAVMGVAALSAATPEEAAPPEEWGDTREHAVTLLRARVSDPDRLRHALGVEAIMKELAREQEGDPTQWGVAGLLHDIDLAETKDEPSSHGPVGARLLEEEGFSEAVIHAVEAHDDAAGVTRTLAIAHALYCADRAYWAIHASGLRFPSPEAAGATSAFVVEELERRGITGRIDAELRAECARLGLTVEDLLGFSLHALRAMPDPQRRTRRGR